jgi:hypothetical protein
VVRYRGLRYRFLPSQAPFPYQAKTLRWLRTSYETLPAAAKRTVDALLEGTGCEALFAMMG